MVAFSFDNVFAMMRSLDASVGVIMIAAGIALIFIGHRVYKPAVALTYGLAGYLIATQYLQNDPNRLSMSLGSALAVAVLAFLLSKHAFAAMSGVAGAFLLMNFMMDIRCPVELAWIFGSAVFIGLAAMTYVYWMQIVALVTSLEGAFLIIGSIGTIGAISPALLRNFQQMTRHTWIFLPFVIAAPTLIGFFLQTAIMQKRESGGPVA